MEVSLRNGMTYATESDVFHVGNDFFKAGIVLNNDNSFKLSVDSGLTCSLAPGRAYIRNFDYDGTGDTTQLYRVVETDTTSLTFSSNTSGDDRYDTVVIRIDKTAIPNSNASNIADIYVVEGTPGNGVLSDSDINTALGSNYYWIRLYDVKIGNGVSDLTGDDLYDRRVIVNIPEVIEVGNNSGKFSTLKSAIDYINNNSDISSAYIRVASGIYEINNAIQITKPVTIVGRGNSTKLVITSNVSDATDAIQAWWYSGSYYNSSAPKIFVLKDLVIEDQRTTQSGTDATDIVSIDHAYYVNIDNVYFKGGQDSHVFLSECTYFSVTNSVFENAGDLGLYIDNTDLSVAGGYVSGNHFEGTTAGGIAIKRNGGKVVIAHNSINNAGNGITLEDTGEAGNSVLGLNNSDKSIITGNIIDNIHTSGQGQFGISLKGSENVIISNNFIRDVGVYGIRVVASRYNLLIGNQVIDCDTRCIHIGAFNSVKSEHNSFVGNVAADSPQGIIEIPGEADWNEFVNNKYKRIADFSSPSSGSGTATFTKNSNIVTGSGSTWSSEIPNTSYVWLDSDGDQYAVEIEQRVSDTEIRLKGDYLGDGGDGTIMFVPRGPGIQIRGDHSKNIMDFDDKLAWGYYHFYLHGFFANDGANSHRYLDIDANIPATGANDVNTIVRLFRNTHTNPEGTGNGVTKFLSYVGNGTSDLVFAQEGDNFQFYVPVTMKTFDHLPTTSELTTNEMALAKFNGTWLTPQFYLVANQEGTIKSVQLSEKADTFRLLRFEQNTEPTGTDIPQGMHAIWRDTANNKTYLCYNEGGTILKAKLGEPTFLELADTISSYNSGRILFESDSGVTDDAGLYWKDNSLNVKGSVYIEQKSIQNSHSIARSEVYQSALMKDVVYIDNSVLKSGDLTSYTTEDPGGDVYGVWGDGKFIYVAATSAGIHVYKNDTVSGSLVHIDSSNDGGGAAYKIWGDGRFIYLANYSAGLSVYSVNNSGILTYIGSHSPSAEGTLDVWGDGKFVYTVNGVDGLHVYSVDKDGNLTHLDSDSQGDSANAVYGDSRFIYVAYGDIGVHVYRVDDNGQLTHISSYDDGYVYKDVWANEKFMVAVDDHTLAVHTVADDGTITRMGYTYADYYSVWGDNRFVYAGRGSDMVVFDIASGTPYFVATFATSDASLSFWSSKDYLYAALGGSKLMVTNIDNAYYYVKSSKRHYFNGNGLRAPLLSSEPAYGTAGLIYYDTGTNKLRCYDGSNWHDLY